ncbi:SAGA-associated factor 11-like protein isoform X1 [Aphelenchoides fujianensis]|nr:SAGA-associated factor 11-like protein isoform X1 [Aphelenchoides fujianensis]
MSSSSNTTPTAPETPPKAAPSGSRAIPSNAAVDECQPSTSQAVASKDEQKSPADPPDAKPNGISHKDAIRQAYSFFVDALITNTVVKCHREAKLLASVGLTRKEDDPKFSFIPTSNGPSSSSLDHPSPFAINPKKQIECFCCKCGRPIAASRLAPHLETCLGLGRKQRSTRHKPTDSAKLAAVAMGLQSSASPSPRIRQTSATTDTMDAESNNGGDLDDADWNARPTAAMPKRRRTQRPGSGGGDQNLNASNQSTRSSTRSRR